MDVGGELAFSDTSAPIDSDRFLIPLHRVSWQLGEGMGPAK